MSEYILPVLVLILILYCLFKKIAVFDLFCDGAQSALPLVFSVFPFLVGIFFMVEMVEVSGFLDILECSLSGVFEFLGIPSGVISLVIFRPFSGSGSLAILNDIFTQYGVDSYEGRVASCICGAGETVFYMVAVYFSSQGIKKLGSGVFVAIFCSFVSVIVCAICCRVF